MSENINTATNLVGMSAIDFDAILAKAENNSSRKVTLTAEQLQSVQAEQAALHAQLEALRAQIPVKRPVGRPSTGKTAEKPKLDPTKKSDLWFDAKAQTEPFVSIQDSLEKAGLDWELQTTPCGNYFNEAWHEIAGRFNVTRLTDGKVMRQVSQRFAPLQNSQVFAVCDDIIAEFGYNFVKFGEFNDGEKVFATLHCGSYDIAGSEHESKFVVGIGHTGNMSFSTAKAEYVKVCANGLHRWKHDENFGEKALKQTINASGRMEILKRALLSALRNGVSFKDEMQALASRRIADKVARMIFAQSLATAEQLKAKIDMYAAIETENREIVSAQQLRRYSDLNDSFIGNYSHVPKEVEGTAYAALQAATLINTHAPSVKRGEHETESNALFRAQALGSASNHSELVLDLLLKNKEYTEQTLVERVYVV